MRAAIMAGQNIFLPERIHRAIIISTIPKPPRSIASGTIPRMNWGKYPIQEVGFMKPDTAGKIKTKAIPNLNIRFGRFALFKLFYNYNAFVFRRHVVVISPLAYFIERKCESAACFALVKGDIGSVGTMAAFVCSAISGV